MARQGEVDKVTAGLEFESGVAVQKVFVSSTRSWDDVQLEFTAVLVHVFGGGKSASRRYSGKTLAFA